MQSQHKGCFKCNSVGHFTKDCPNNNFTNKYNQHSTPNTNRFNKTQKHTQRSPIENTAKLDDLVKTLSELLNKHKEFNTPSKA